MGHLEGAGDTRIDGKCDVWVCLEERSIGTSRLSEEDRSSGLMYKLFPISLLHIYLQ